jgi:GDP-L-fucose synthase
MMDKNSLILVATEKNFVGSSILRRLKELGYKNILKKRLKEYDFLDKRKMQEFFQKEKPEYVFLTKEKVGGILANTTYPADFIYQNLAIQINIIDAAYRAGVKKLLFLGSSCSYPRECPQPMKEEYLLTGPLEPTNEAYAVAKIAGIKMCQAYNIQYGTCFICAIPANLYGAGDDFHPQNSHVIPALIRRFHEAKIKGEDKVVIWGSGRPRRDFLYVDDFADACIFLMREYSGNEPINVGSSKDVSISELAGMIKEIVQFKGEIIYDESRPDGMPKKLLDTSKINALGWKPKVSLQDGLERTYRWFKNVSSKTSSS